MAPQAFKKYGFLPPVYLHIASGMSNGVNSDQVPGTFTILTILALSLQASAQSERRFLTPILLSERFDEGAKMRKLMVGSLISISLISLLSTEEPLVASDSTPPAVPSGVVVNGGNCPDFKELPIIREQQRTSSWCWATAAKIAMHYRGAIHEQCFLVDAVRQNQLGIYTPNTCCIAHPEMTQGCGDVFDYAWAVLNEFNFSYAAEGESTFGWPQLREQICSDKPIIYSEDMWNGPGHEYVIYGYIEDRTIDERTVVIHDPIDSDRHEWDYDSYLRMQPIDEPRSYVEFLINIHE